MKRGLFVMLTLLLLEGICYGEKPWLEMTHEERVTFIKQEELSNHVVCNDLVMSTTSFGQYSYECRRRKELAEIEEGNATKWDPIATQPHKPWTEMIYEERLTIIKSEERAGHAVCDDLVMSTTSFGQYSYECRRRKELLEIEKEEAKRKDAIANQPKHIQEEINSNKIKLGMTREQVLLSWGKPNKINRTVGKWGVKEQWCYGDKTYLYFENGILTSFQD